MINEKKITWCENWLKKVFEKYPSIECNLLFQLATKANLYTQGTYGSELSVALENVGTKVRSVSNSNGEFLYHAFYM